MFAQELGYGMLPDMGEAFDQLRAEISAVRAVRDVGRVTEVSRTMIMVTGLSQVAGLGDQVRWISSDWRTMFGEIVRISSEGASVIMAGPTDGIVIGDRVQHFGPCEIAPDDSWLGRIVDPLGRALDGRPLLRGLEKRPLQTDPPPASDRRPLGKRLETGLAVFNTLLPVVQGQRVGLFAGSGVGKSMLLGQLANGIEADIVVYALVGERGRELRDIVDNVIGRDRMAKSVLVAATSDQSPLSRRRCLWSAMAIAEHFRDLGHHVLLLADSVTRFAEAHREIAFSSGENGALRGYPPSVAQAIMALAERAGPGSGHAGDITAIFSVLVAGSDMEEPVSDILRGVLDGHVVLDRTIAERGRFPAIDLLRSVSRSLPDAATPAENVLIADARRLLGTYDKVALMVQSGLYTPGSDPDVDRAIAIWPKLDDFVAQSEDGNVDDSFQRLRACLEAQEPVT